MPVTVTVLYPATSNETFNFEYYQNEHMPFMAEESKPYGLKGYTVTRFLASPTAANPLAPPTYTTQSTLEFDNIDQVKEAFTHAGQKVKEGLGKVCAGVEPQIIVGEVVARRTQGNILGAMDAGHMTGTCEIAVQA